MNMFLSYKRNAKDIGDIEKITQLSITPEHGDTFHVESLLGINFREPCPRDSNWANPHTMLVYLRAPPENMQEERSKISVPQT